MVILEDKRKSMVPAWRNEYKVADDKINNQHRKLFSLVAKIDKTASEKANRVCVGEVFKEFSHYMKEHFSYEEDYMQKIGYPKLKEHQKQHENIINEITSILKTYKTFQDIHKAVKDTSRRWLSEHIIDHDFQYEKWRKENKK